ncbi:dephospho-CoA kinase [Christensenellaceae bacterium OttesenSCG-928-K19]|nr:dephospho-CoA kinase [Christensenellaceae bacterium OttesenSCG-928-K19]
MNNRIIGLMGNSGSGKSTVADYLKAKSAYIIDADEVSHRICEVGQPGLAAVKERFDPYFFNEDGSLNRRRMGRFVFANKAELRKLEDVLHPIILQEVKRELKEHKESIVVIDCALLIKTNLYLLADEVWLVKAETDTKIERICGRDHIPYDQALNRLRNQMPDSEMLRYADVVLMNDGSKEMLLEQVDEYL